MKKLTFIIFCLSFTSALIAQAPQAFSYQGVARQSNGAPIGSQSIALRVAILQNGPTGAELYKEEHAVVTNPLGLFVLQVGTGNTLLGDFTAIEWGDGPYFFQVEMDENGNGDFLLIGTSQLLSVPYALHAGNGSKWTDYELIDNTFPFIGRKIGLQYTNGSSSIKIARQNEPNLSYDFAPIMSFDENYGQGLSSSFSLVNIIREEYNYEPTLEFVVGNTEGPQRNFSFRTLGQSRLFLKGNGNIGIGTTSPAAKLHVTNGDVYISNVNRGIVMRSSNGQCWRYVPDNSGILTGTPIPCPN